VYYEKVFHHLTHISEIQLTSTPLRLWGWKDRPGVVRVLLRSFLPRRLYRRADGGRGFIVGALFGLIDDLKYHRW